MADAVIGAREVMIRLKKLEPKLARKVLRQAARSAGRDLSKYSR